MRRPPAGSSITQEQSDAFEGVSVQPIIKMMREVSERINRFTAEKKEEFVKKQQQVCCWTAGPGALSLRAALL